MRGRSQDQATRPVTPIIMLVAMLAVMLAGCGTAVRAGAAAAPDPTAHQGTARAVVADAVLVLRVSAFPEHHIPPLEQTVADAGKVQRLYDALHALPTYDRGASCPALYIGAWYDLTFSRDGVNVSWAKVMWDGCRAVFLPNRDKRWTLNQPGFWQLFAATLGVSESTLAPVPQPTGPSAPTPTPGPLWH